VLIASLPLRISVRLPSQARLLQAAQNIGIPGRLKGHTKAFAVPSTEKSFGSEEEPVTAAALSEIAGQRLCNCCFNVLKMDGYFSSQETIPSFSTVLPTLFL
jgi:hypothetical protein